MSKIRTLADEIRERIQSEENSRSKNWNGETYAPPIEGKTPTTTVIRHRKGATKIGNNKELEVLIREVRAHQLTGQEKLLLRLDTSTVFLLKQLKIALGIDMTQFISFCLHHFLEHHPTLKEHIKNSLNNFDL